MKSSQYLLNFFGVVAYICMATGNASAMAEDESRDHSKSSLPLSFIVNCKDKPEKQEKERRRKIETRIHPPIDT